MRKTIQAAVTLLAAATLAAVPGLALADDFSPPSEVSTCATIVATGFTGYMRSVRYADIHNDCDHPVNVGILVPLFGDCGIIEPGETQRRLWPAGLGPHQGLHYCDED